MRRMRPYIRSREVLQMVGGFFLAVVLIGGGAVGIARWQESQGAAVSDVPKETMSDAWHDGSYQPKKNLSAYLFLGIDRDGPVKSNQSYIDGGQADVQLLLVIDKNLKTWQILQINRDSMVEVPVLGVTGQVVRTQLQQIALAHAYGDGTQDSCRNAVRAVSNMLGGQEIDGYLALNMGGIPVLTDLLGGVEVTVDEDFSQVDPSLVKGQKVTLSGEQAYSFVRSRKDVGDQTNISRMERHREYINGLMEKVRQLDEGEILEGYDALSSYLVTDLGSQTLLDLFEMLGTYTNLETLTIEGVSYLDETGANAYALNQESLEQVILQLFYTADLQNE